MQQIKNLVPEANRKEIQVVDDLTTISDAYLLRGLRNARLLTSTEFKILDGVCATYRNIAAHASQKKSITDAEVSSAVENMIEFLEKPVWQLVHTLFTLDSVNEVGVSVKFIKQDSQLWTQPKNLYSSF